MTSAGLGASLVAQMVKNLPAAWETWFWSLGWDDPLEKGMATHSSILGWRIPWKEEPGRLQSKGSQRVGHDWATFTFSVGLDESQAGIKIARRNTNNLRYADGNILMAKSEEELRSLLMRAKKEVEKAGLKLHIQKTKNMASGPITSWQIDG